MLSTVLDSGNGLRSTGHYYDCCHCLRGSPVTYWPEGLLFLCYHLSCCYPLQSSQHRMQIQRKYVKWSRSHFHAHEQPAQHNVLAWARQGQRDHLSRGETNSKNDLFGEHGETSWQSSYLILSLAYNLIGNITNLPQQPQEKNVFGVWGELIITSKQWVSYWPVFKVQPSEPCACCYRWRQSTSIRCWMGDGWLGVLCWWGERCLGVCMGSFPHHSQYMKQHWLLTFWGLEKTCANAPPPPILKYTHVIKSMHGKYKGTTHNTL